MSDERDEVLKQLWCIAEARIKQSHEANACGDHVESQRLAVEVTHICALGEVIKTLHRIEELLIPVHRLAESMGGAPE